jgi:hypothetical protein
VYKEQKSRKDTETRKKDKEASPSKAAAENIPEEDAEVEDEGVEESAEDVETAA